MEDENSLELSLGLSCGGSTGKSGKPKDTRTDFNVSEGGAVKPSIGNLNIEQQSHDNFWNDLGQKPAVGDSDASSYREFWVSDSKMADSPEDKSGFSKRKMPFEDLESVKRPETGGNGFEGGQQKALQFDISTNLENDSSAEKETVAESEGDVSASWLMLKRGDVSGSSEALNVSDKHLARYSTLLGSQGNAPQSGSVHEPSTTLHGNLAYGSPLSLHPPEAAPVQSMGPSKGPNVASTVEPSRMPSLIMPASTMNDESVNFLKSSDLNLAFGYPSFQLPTLETGSSWMLNPNAVMGVATAERKDITEAASDAVRSEGSMAHPEEVVRRPSPVEDENGETTPAFKSLENASQALVKGFPPEGSIIRRGAAPGLKIGGCGSSPDLPWVSVTGSGPNGKTISGVTYKFSQSQIKIVCACHGSHMSPEEFIQHANAVDAEAEPNVGLSSFSFGNPATSA